ncbi:hypothetical protein BU24DRAFT_158176 [Aaosphaeria arxii CBS 175.79]|uniref:Uncharacterized protein n=1 Tax=Aaosphaeria arxii CBS 175.79 TaxID=1450172 RepID=A0A6A5XYQ3_9PLEO|nr:uncharacterized protein BU24DRAFT_158176 [Aaosphaeria arxii CBS 175.79]KAF2017760.1 hypothetical protein BU24DRAFT_158176 [Aaosphaeria arxii CBS 175.79]
MLHYIQMPISMDGRNNWGYQIHSFLSPLSHSLSSNIISLFLLLNQSLLLPPLDLRLPTQHGTLLTAYILLHPTGSPPLIHHILPPLCHILVLHVGVGRGRELCCIWCEEGQKEGLHCKQEDRRFWDMDVRDVEAEIVVGEGVLQERGGSVCGEDVGV